MILTYLPSPSAVTLRLPAKACDSHVHIFGPRHKFPFSKDRSFTPVDAAKEQLFELHQILGIERCVIVQSLIHGFDNAVVEDAIRAGEGRYLGVSLVPANVADSELVRLANAGIRGVRFNFMKHLGQSANIDEVIALTPRLKAAGLHLQVHFESSLIHALEPRLRQSAVPVVIDHMARVDAKLGVANADFQALCELLKSSLFSVKVSGIDRVDSQVDRANPQAPIYQHGISLARHLVQNFPAQCVWGTDWPHPNHTHIPDDGVLVDALAQIAPSARLLQALMVDNPQQLYRFEA